ncbi:MAG: hypothetical protein AAFR92_08690 [Pseudomonadota bacterium]
MYDPTAYQLKIKGLGGMINRVNRVMLVASLLTAMTGCSESGSEDWYSACLVGIAEEERANFPEAKIMQTCGCMNEKMTEAQWHDIASAPENQGRAGKVAAIEADTRSTMESCGY